MFHPKKLGELSSSDPIHNSFQTWILCLSFSEALEPDQRRGEFRGEFRGLRDPKSVEPKNSSI